MPASKPSCIVIGAGLAGLTAALRLAERGWKVDIFEAFNFFGGRVFTHQFEQAPNLNCELGAEWIGDDHDHMKALCEQFKLKTQPHRYSSAFPVGATQTAAPFLRAGAWPFRAKERRLRKFLKKFKGFDEHQQKQLDRYDWWTWLETQMGFKQEDLLKRDLMDSTDFGETIRLTPAFVAAAEYAGSNRFDEMDKKVIGGNHRLPEKMKAKILAKGGRFHLGKRVIRIVQKNLTVSVTADTLRWQRHRHRPPTPKWVKPKTKCRADFCICTIPARALSSIKWNPPLPDEHVEAANQLQYCRIAKTAVLYKTRFWEHGKYKPSGGGYSWFTDGVSDFCFDATQKQRGDKRGIICSYAIGDKADDLANAEPSELMKWITQDIARASGLDPEPLYDLAIDIEQQPWQQNPFTQGAYAYYRSGQWFTVHQTLQRSHLRVHFAGEHLDEDWQGFMEGAVRTGEAAAARI